MKGHSIPTETAYEARNSARATARFEVLRTLGAGGMGSVSEVRDSSSGKHFALKRLHHDSDEKRSQRALELFEREFYTLSQISHPNVVEVYDYGVDDQGAYYTMELLEGGELRQLGPLAPSEICRLGRELCSALALLHSREMLFRDLSPRNVHCTADRRAKLIDFGAVMPMGLPRNIVGTPTCCAPEAIDMHPLDARSDLYSLGATLYFALTGKYAFAARSFAHLRQLLDTQPTRPSELVADVPARLEALLLELLHVDPQLRPASAHEVMERLAAIEGRPIEESLQVSHAYLMTPTLVGREQELQRVHSKLRRALVGRGCALLIEGASGSGRTRMLAACSLDGKVLGALVLHADATSADADFGVVRALARGLLEQAPELARSSAGSQLASLGQLLPELIDAQPAIELRTFADASERREALLAAVREWFLAIARQRPLLIAVDDLDRADEASAALVALCAHDAARHALAVLATRETKSAASASFALDLLASAGSALALSDLSAQHSEELLRSVFGDVPHVAGVTRALQAIAQGNPRDTLQLAQYLVDKGLAVYHSGAWSLPASFDGAELPQDMANVFNGRVAGLSAAALELGRLISLAQDRPIGIGECIAVCSELSPQIVHDGVSELARTRVCDSVGDRFAIAQRGLHAALRGGLTSADRARLHGKLAELFARRGDEEFRRATHLLRAGASADAVDALVHWAVESQRVTNPDPLEFMKLVASMPHDWLETYTAVIELCERLDRPAVQSFALRSRFAALCDVLRVPSAITNSQLSALLRQLGQDSGVTEFASLDPQLPAQDRVLQALQRAAARHQADTSGVRTLEPLLALKQLVRAQFLSAGVAAIALDLPFWSELPLLTPFAALSPAIGVVDQFVAAIGTRLSGRIEAAVVLYRALLERLDQPDRGGLEESYHRFVRYGVACGIGVLEVGLGYASCVTWADQVEAEPLYRVNAFRIRMLHLFWQGRVREAEALRDRIELLRLESCPRTFQDGIHLFPQTVVHAISDDLTRLRHIIAEIEGVTAWRPAWRPVLDYALGEYQRIRGDHESAARYLQAALAATTASTHQVWAYAAGAYTTVLRLQRRGSEAVAFATESLQAAERAELGYAMHFIRMPLALALADTDAFAEASELADDVIAQLIASGREGLTRGLAFEVRARIAIRAHDATAYERALQSYASYARQLESPILRSRCERLTRLARQGLRTSSDVVEYPSTNDDQLSAYMQGCSDASEYASRILQLLLRDSGASSGLLYWVSNTGPQLAAQIGDELSPQTLTGLITDLIDAELQASEIETQAGSGDAETEAQSPWGRIAAESSHRFALMCHATVDGLAVTGIAALRPAVDPPYTHPAQLATRLSELAAAAGVVTPVSSRAEPKS
jgi:hypothetical protein